MKITRGCTQ